MIETNGIYTISSSTHSSPSMSLITRSSELAWLLQVKWTLPHTSVHRILLFRHLFHPRLHTHFTKFERACDVTVLCYFVVVVNAVRVLQQIHAVTLTALVLWWRTYQAPFHCGYSYHSSNHLQCQWTVARTHMVAETSKSVFVLKHYPV